MTRETGTLTLWDDDRGYGFVTSDGGERLFVHIKSIGRIATRPRVGDKVSFEIGKGRDGRAAATAVVIAGANPVQPVSRRTAEDRTETRDYFRVGAAFVLIGMVMLAVILDRAPIWLVAGYGGLGLVSAIAYAADKTAAQGGRWRTAENSLHLFDLAGGIAGGLLAQQMLRHKTAKATFIAVTAAITILHFGLLAALLLGIYRLG